MNRGLVTPATSNAVLGPRIVFSQRCLVVLYYVLLCIAKGCYHCNTHWGGKILKLRSGCCLGLLPLSQEGITRKLCLSGGWWRPRLEVRSLTTSPLLLGHDTPSRAEARPYGGFHSDSVADMIEYWPGLERQWLHWSKKMFTIVEHGWPQWSTEHVQLLHRLQLACVLIF